MTMDLQDIKKGSYYSGVTGGRKQGATVKVLERSNLLGHTTYASDDGYYLGAVAAESFGRDFEPVQV